MALSEPVRAVSRMQAYIAAHLGEPIRMADLSRAAGYSPYHAARLFKKELGQTPFAYIRALRLTKAAEILRDSGGTVTDAAEHSGFDSHDGFTRAFTRQFAITPQKYRRETPSVHWFVPHPIEAYYYLKEGGESMPKEPIQRTMTVTAVERPARKLILKRSVNATCYLTYSEEVGCEWEGLFNSISEKFDTSALFTLPQGLIAPGTGATASGVEVPPDYSKPIPTGCDVIDLPPYTMLYFQGAPFADENDFGEAIGLLWELMDAYNPVLYGWEYAPELAPYCNFGAFPQTGAKMARPVRKTGKT